MPCRTREGCRATFILNKLYNLISSAPIRPEHQYVRINRIEIHSTRLCRSCSAQEAPNREFWSILVPLIFALPSPVNVIRTYYYVFYIVDEAKKLNTCQIKRRYGITGHMRQVTSRPRNITHGDSVCEPVNGRCLVAIGNYQSLLTVSLTVCFHSQQIDINSQKHSTRSESNRMVLCARMCLCHVWSQACRIGFITLCQL